MRDLLLQLLFVAAMWTGPVCSHYQNLYHYEDAGLEFFLTSRDMCKSFFNKRPYDEPCPHLDPDLAVDRNCYCEMKKDVYGRIRYCCDFQGHAFKLKTVVGHYTSHFSKSEQFFAVFDHRKVRYLSLSEVSLADLRIKETPEKTLIALYALNSSIGSLPRLKSFVLSWSNVDSMENILDFDRLFMYNSEIRRMQNLNHKLNTDLEKVCKRTNFGQLVARMPHKTGSFVINKYHTIMQHSRVGTIDDFTVGSLLMNHTAVDIIYPYGVKQFEGPLIMYNVSVRHMHRDAIVGYHTTVHMEDVVIEHCDEPCFVIPKSLTLFKNITINGRKVENTTDLALLAGLRHASLDRNLPDYCRYRKGDREQSELICSLQNLNSSRPLEMHLRTKIPSPYITVENHHDIDIIEGCYTVVTLRNVTGYYHKLHNARQLKCEGSATLVIVESHLETVYSRFVGEIVLENSNTTCLDLGLVRTIFMRISNVGEIENVELITNDEPCIFETPTILKSQIGYIRQMVLRTNMGFYDTKIEKMAGLIIDMSLELFGGSITIDRCTIGEIATKGIHVVNGSLDLIGVEIKKINPDMIYLEKGTWLKLENIKSFTCPYEFPAISVEHRWQVQYNNERHPYWLYYCIKVRKAGSRDLQYPYYAQSLGRSYQQLPIKGCSEDFPRTLRCWLGNLKDTALLGDSSELDYYHDVFIYEAADLAIGQHCFRNLNIYSSSVTSMKRATSCPLSMSVFKSNVSLVTNIINYLGVEYSHVQKIDRDFTGADAITLLGSTIDHVSAVTNHSYITDCSVKKLSQFRVKTYQEVRNSMVELIVSDGLEIMMYAEAKFIDSTIGKMETKGILVHGFLSLENVNIQEYTNGDIQFGIFSTIIFKNVSFSNHCLFGVDLFLDEEHRQVDPDLGLTISGIGFNAINMTRNECNRTTVNVGEKDGENVQEKVNEEQAVGEQPVRGQPVGEEPAEGNETVGNAWMVIIATCIIGIVVLPFIVYMKYEVMQHEPATEHTAAAAAVAPAAAAASTDPTAVDDPGHDEQGRVTRPRTRTKPRKSTEPTEPTGPATNTRSQTGGTPRALKKP